MVNQENDSSSASPAEGELDERLPFFQHVLESPFLLLFLGITLPTVFYLIWGIMEVVSIPIAS